METPCLLVAVSAALMLDFAAGYRDGLAGDGAGALAAQPEYGIGDLLRCHQPSLRIVLCKLRHRLLAAAASLLHDVVDAAGNQIGVGEAGAHGVDGDRRVR